MNETYRFPDLTYDNGALEPDISRKVMELHHGRHHTGYVVQQVYDHQGNHGRGTIPLLANDVWEDAYYQHYLNFEGDFFDAVWQVVNWADVAERLTAARRPEA